MPYIIDGHNLIPKIPGLNLGEMDVELSLIKMLQDYCRKHEVRIEVFFDKASQGHAGTRKHGRVIANFIRQGSSADTAIRTRLRNAGRSSRNIIVVTSDREVAAASREMGAKVISSEVFLNKHLQDKALLDDDFDKEIDPSIDPEEVNQWLDLFNKDQD